VSASTRDGVTTRRAGSARDVSPFPFEALASLTRDQVQGAASARRLLRAFVDASEVERAAAELLGGPVRLRGPASFAAPARGQGDVGVLLAPVTPVAARSPADAALVELEGPLAAATVARVVRQPPPAIPEASRPVPAPVAGAAAAVVAEILRRGGPRGGVLRTVAAGPAAVLARDLEAAVGPLLSAAIEVAFGERRFVARVTLPAALLAAPPTMPVLTPPREATDLTAFRAMGDARLALSLVVATTLASRRDLRALAPGDAFVPTGVSLHVPTPAGTGTPTPTPASAGAGADWLTGPVALIAPRGEHGLRADLAGGGRLVVRERGLSLPWSAELPMTDPGPESHAPLVTRELLDDAPVVVRVELGAVEMTAREWTELTAGDVIPLGRRLGEPALLRVGGAELARGELVVVDGEYAVRILARSDR